MFSGSSESIRFLDQLIAARKVSLAVRRQFNLDTDHSAGNRESAGSINSLLCLLLQLLAGRKVSLAVRRQLRRKQSAVCFRVDARYQFTTNSDLISLTVLNQF